MHNFLTTLADTRSVGAKGYGSFARTAIAQGTIVATFGGLAANRHGLANFPEERQRRSMQIDIDLFLIGPVQREPGDCINHSCAPNCGMRNATQVVAMQDIEEGAELTFDYAMSDTSDYDEFVCSCSTNECRGVVRAGDWRRDDVQQRYAGFFSPYVQRLIRSSHRSRLLTKHDAERLLLEIEHSPVMAVLHALRIVVGSPDASWATAIAMYCNCDTRQPNLLAFDTTAIDHLAGELNETRGALYANREG
ncbi:MAG: SET domain-containing protein-lysine N-methyltransferase [Ilumatobacteraceae bacterium]